MTRSLEGSSCCGAEAAPATFSAALAAGFAATVAGASAAAAEAAGAGSLATGRSDSSLRRADPVDGTALAAARGAAKLRFWRLANGEPVDCCCLATAGERACAVRSVRRDGVLRLGTTGLGGVAWAVSASGPSGAADGLGAFGALSGATVGANASKGGSTKSTKRRVTRCGQPTPTLTVTTGSSMAVLVTTRSVAWVGFWPGSRVNLTDGEDSFTSPAKTSAATHS